MADWKKIVEKRAGELLGDGEEVGAAFLGQASTAVRDVAGHSDFTASLAALPKLPAVGREKVTKALELPLRQDAIFAVTTLRLLVFKQKLGLRSPNLALAHQYPAADVAALAVEGGIGLRKVSVIFSDRSGTVLSVPRGQGDIQAVETAYATQTRG